MENKDNFNNVFKFGIYIGDDMICERIFSGNDYNQATMYQIDVRPIINSIQKRVQNLLSSNNLTYDILGYSILKYYKNNSDLSKLNIPKTKSIEVNNKTFSGVEIKIGFYLNDNTILERFIYLNKYNPTSRFSNELYSTVLDIVEDLKNKIKQDDINLMWEDYGLINKYNLHISQIRELSKEERRNLLNRI